MKTLLKYTLIISMVFLWAACDKDPKPDNGNDGNGNGDDSIPPIELHITQFAFHELSPQVEASIDEEAKKIKAVVPQGTDLSYMAVTVEYTEGAELSPPSGYSYNFADPVEFKLSKNQQSVSYTVAVEHEPAEGAKLYSLSFPDLFVEGEIDGNTISAELLFGSDLEPRTIEIELSEGASSDPASGSKVNLSAPFDITVSSQSGQTNVYHFSPQIKEQETGVRAFWIPDPAHTSFLSSKANIEAGVAMAKELNFNTLYVVAWARTMTLYPSQVLADNSEWPDSRAGMFTPTYNGDPLADLIEAAHKADLKVILWYEYGFMARHGNAPTPQNDKILAVNPHWESINSSGNASNYNSSDFYYNGYHHEVQQFMIDLIMEAVNRYDIDGIQGDDRMPAMPRNSGYDTYTSQKYQDEFGSPPPASPNNSQFVRWRADILNEFGKTLHNTVKAADPNLIVAFSPNPYPWSFDNLMQEWPVWLNEGIVDILSVQSYRLDIDSYIATVNQALHHFSTNGDGNKLRFSPGIILRAGHGNTDADLIMEKIKFNRSVGITGESYFYDVPLNNDQNIRRVIKAMYPGPALFPNL